MGGSLCKGEFETTKEYEERLRKNAFPYQCSIAIDKYDADRGGFESHIFGTTILVKVPRERAREILGRKDRLMVDGTLRYIDAGTVELTNIALVDPASRDRFVVVKIADPDRGNGQTSAPAGTARAAEAGRGRGVARRGR